MKLFCLFCKSDFGCLDKRYKNGMYYCDRRSHLLQKAARGVRPSVRQSVSQSVTPSHTRHTFALLISPQPLPRSMPDFAHTLLTCQSTTSKDPRSSRDPQLPGGPPRVKNEHMCKNYQMTTPTGLLTGNSWGPPTPGAPERMQKWWRPQWRTPCHCSSHKMP